jgi:hypothetical protein
MQAVARVVEGWYNAKQGVLFQRQAGVVSFSLTLSRSSEAIRPRPSGATVPILSTSGGVLRRGLTRPTCRARSETAERLAQQ